MQYYVYFYYLLNCIAASAVIALVVVIWNRRELYRWAIMASRSLYHLWDLKGRQNYSTSKQLSTTGPTNYPIVGSLFDFRWNVFGEQKFVENCQLA